MKCVGAGFGVRRLDAAFAAVLLFPLLVPLPLPLAHAGDSVANSYPPVVQGCCDYGGGPNIAVDASGNRATPIRPFGPIRPIRPISVLPAVFRVSRLRVFPSSSLPLFPVLRVSASLR